MAFRSAKELKTAGVSRQPSQHTGSAISLVMIPSATPYVVRALRTAAAYHENYAQLILF
jgi:hypothetical protein